MFKTIGSIFIFFIICQTCDAQIQSIIIGINGLTCSQCQYSVEQSVMKLREISNMSMDLNTNEATMDMEVSNFVDVLKIGDQVIKSGFSVRFLKIILHLDSSFHILNSQIKHPHGPMVVLDNTQLIRDSTYTFQVIDKKFTKRNIYKRYQTDIKNYPSKNPTGKTPVFLIQLPTLVPPK